MCEHCLSIVLLSPLRDGCPAFHCQPKPSMCEQHFTFKASYDKPSLVNFKDRFILRDKALVGKLFLLFFFVAGCRFELAFDIMMNDDIDMDMVDGRCSFDVRLQVINSLMTATIFRVLTTNEKTSPICPFCPPLCRNDEAKKQILILFHYEQRW